MKIGIDARFYGPRSKGLGRYTQQLLTHLLKQDGEDEYVVFTLPEHAQEIPDHPRVTVRTVRARWYSFAEQVVLPYTLLRERCDLLHFPHFNVPLLYRRPFVVTIHDLILLRYPTVRSTTRPAIVYWLKFFVYRWVIRSAIMRACHVITVSRFTRDDVRAHYPCIRAMSVTYEAAFDIPDIPTSEAVRTCHADYGIMKPYFLYVGNAYPHKNLERLVQAFLHSRSAQTHTLVLVGKEDYFYHRLRTEYIDGKDGDVRIIHDISDEHLRALYAGATAFLFPSLYEGFGLPPLEAMQQGCPVVASRASCIPEIVGDAALCVDATDEHALSTAIDRIATDTSLREQLRARGYVRVQAFSWDRMAQETQRIYHDAAKTCHTNIQHMLTAWMARLRCIMRWTRK